MNPIQPKQGGKVPSSDKPRPTITVSLDDLPQLKNLDVEDEFDCAIHCRVVSKEATDGAEPEKSNDGRNANLVLEVTGIEPKLEDKPDSPERIQKRARNFFNSR